MNNNEVKYEIYEEDERFEELKVLSNLWNDDEKKLRRWKIFNDLSESELIELEKRGR